MISPILLGVSLLPIFSIAHAVNPPLHGLNKRAPQQSSIITATSLPASRGGGGGGRSTAIGTGAVRAQPTLASGATSNAVIQTGAITSNGIVIAPAATSTQPTSALPTIFAAGTRPTLVAGAPPLPDLSTIRPAEYPALDKLPPLDSPQMKQWISQIDMTKIPNIPPTSLGGCSNSSNAASLAAAGANGNCWWTCGHCTRNTDITFCPNKGTWGVSYDDGPSPDTPKLLDDLKANNISATFFVVGSRVISRPQMLQTGYAMGHQISVHTWSHQTLTTLSNEGIIAELAWSKAVIKAVTGVTPNTMRPPFGDIDDRVRYISLQLGLTPIIWTTDSHSTYDTQDWQIASGQVSQAQVLQNFQNILGNASTLDTGFIVLQHDLLPLEVNLAVDVVLPKALSQQPALKLEPIISCLGSDLHQAYAETYTGATNIVNQSGNLTSSGGGTGNGQRGGDAGTAPSTPNKDSAASSIKGDFGQSTFVAGLAMVALALLW